MEPQIIFALKRKPYQVFVTGLRVWILNRRIYTYPDVMVVAGELEFAEVLKAVKDDILGGYLQNLKSLISANIFSDFLEMAKYLLGEDYKDAAAVLIGGTLKSI